MIDFKAAYAGLTFAKDALKFTLDQKVDQKVQEKVSEAMERIGKVQDDLFLVREELLRLQEENHSLKEEVREKQGWDVRMSGYNLMSTEGGATLFQSTTEPRHYVCPSCTEKKEIHVLQNSNERGSIVFCPSCKTKYQVKRIDRAIAVGSMFSR